MKPWTKLLLLAVFGIVAAQILVQRSRGPALSMGEAAPPLALMDLEGRTVDLGALKGKVVAVNFWATWCGPCRVELPELAAVWRTQKDACFELLGVAEESAWDDVRRLAPEIPYPILVDERAEALGPWRVAGFPRTFVVDTDGKVRHVFEGSVRASELERVVRPLLPASCPARS